VGLHRYFAPLLADSGLYNTWGIADLLWDYRLMARRHVGKGEMPSARIYDELRKNPYSTRVEWRFPKHGQLNLMPIGRPTPKLKNRIQLFVWREFIDRLDGISLLRTLEEDLRHSYDYILIDLPNLLTAPSPTSFFIQRRMSDDIIACLTLDESTIDTTARALKLIIAAEDQARHGVFPVPMRVEPGELRLLEEQRATLMQRFGQWIRLPLGVSGNDYWSRIEIPQIPFYMYSKVLAVIAERPSQHGRMLAAYEALTSFASQGQVRRSAVLTDFERHALMATFESFVPPAPSSDTFEAPLTPYQGEERYFFVSYAREDADSVWPIMQKLQDLGMNLWWDVGIPGAANWSDFIRRQIVRSTAMVLFASERSLISSYVLNEIQEGRRHNKPLLTVRLDAVPPPSPFLTLLSAHQMVDAFASNFDLQLNQTVQYLEQVD
jgi:hypothetical protein